MSLRHMCWCCLLRPSEKDMTKPYISYGITEIYSDMLVECFEIHITQGHELKCGICDLCVRRLRDARDFKLQVQRSQADLRAWLEKEVHVKDEKPNVQQIEMVNKDAANDYPMLHEEFTVKPDIVEDNFNSKSEEPTVKLEITHDGAAETTMAHEDPPAESEMSENEMSDADLMLHEPDVDIATAPDINSEYAEEADNESNQYLPTRSKDRYVSTYESFISWKTDKNISSFSENVLLAYFEEIAAKYKPTSLWAMYSMLKKILKTKHCVNMGDYVKLSAFLRRNANGYVSKKAKVLTVEDVDRFIDEAPDEKYLATKVALIFGVTGALRRDDLAKLTTNHLQNHNEVLLVKFPHTKNKMPVSFVIEGKYYSVVKKYEKLRSHKATDTRFFQQYRNGKCTAQGIGKNKFGSMPKEVAQYLNLSDAKSYSGISFRRTAASLLYYKNR